MIDQVLIEALRRNGYAIHPTGEGRQVEAYKDFGENGWVNIILTADNDPVVEAREGSRWAGERVSLEGAEAQAYINDCASR